MDKSTMAVYLELGLDPILVSIKKWQDINDPNDTIQYNRLITAENCALCSVYFINDECEGCPIREKTGKSCCEGTPYDDFVTEEERKDYDKAEEYRLEMVGFLRILAIEHDLDLELTKKTIKQISDLKLKENPELNKIRAEESVSTGKED